MAKPKNKKLKAKIARVDVMKVIDTYQLEGGYSKRVQTLRQLMDNFYAIEEIERAILARQPKRKSISADIRNYFRVKDGLVKLTDNVSYYAELGAVVVGRGRRNFWYIAPHCDYLKAQGVDEHLPRVKAYGDVVKTATLLAEMATSRDERVKASFKAFNTWCNYYRQDLSTTERLHNDVLVNERWGMMRVGHDTRSLYLLDTAHPLVKEGAQEVLLFGSPEFYEKYGKPWEK